MNKLRKIFSNLLLLSMGILLCANTSFAIVPHIQNPTVTLATYKAGDADTATFSFTTVQTLTNTDEIRITFPATEDISNVTWEEVSCNIPGDYFSAPTGQTLKISRANGADVPGGTNITCTVSDVHNQPYEGTTDVFTIATYNNMGNAIDWETATPSGVNIIPNALKNTSVTLDSYTVGDTTTAYFHFTNTNIIGSKDLFTFVFPNDGSFDLSKEKLGSCNMNGAFTASYTQVAATFYRDGTGSDYPANVALTCSITGVKILKAGNTGVFLAYTQTQGGQTRDKDFNISGVTLVAAQAVPTLSGFGVLPNTFNPNNNETTTITYFLNVGANVTTQIKDGNTVVKTLQNNAAVAGGQNSVTWDGKNDSGILVSSKTYSVVVTAFKNGNQTDQKSGSVTVNGTTQNNLAPNITSLTVSPTTFSPTTGTTTVSFVIGLNATVNVWVEDAQGAIVKRLIDTQSKTAGTVTTSWDGKNSNGTVVADGTYKINVKAENLSGSNTTNTNVTVSTSNSSGKCVGFTDVLASDPLCPAITYVKSQGIFSGYANGTFQPGTVINRVETLKVVLLGFKKTLLNADGTKLGFSDVDPSAWYMTYVRTAKNLGIVQGYNDGTFKPAQQINRVELLKIFFKTSGKDLSSIKVTVAPYSDTPVDAWYIVFVQYSKLNNLVDAINNLFYPAQGMKRGDVATLFYRFHQAGLDK